MALKFYSLIFVILFTGCFNHPKISKSVVVIFKTPIFKFYDRGFITKYDSKIHLQIYNAGQVGLNLIIYKNRVCQSTFECMEAKEFNKKYLSSDYSDDFLYKLFNKNKVYFKDKKNKIFIKVKND